MEEIKEESLNAKDWTFVISCILMILELLVPMNIFYGIEPPFWVDLHGVEIEVKSRVVFISVFIIAEVVLTVIYFIPYFIALYRNHNQILPIFLLNLLAGWTFVGWLIALIWACYNYDTVELKTKKSNFGINKGNKNNERKNKK